LRKSGVIIQNIQASHLLGSIDVVFIDIEMPDKDILEIIKKVQFSRGVPCKFLVASSVAKRLQRELLGTLIYPGEQLAKHVPKQFLGMITDAQFITDATLTDVLRLISTMQHHGAKILWVSDGKRPTPIIQAATVSLIISDSARDDCMAHADLIAPDADATILESILYNKK
jgi:chemotaxis response regulator CheB